MANANLEITVKIDPSSVEVVNLIRAANSLLEFRQGIISKEFDKFSPTLCGALHDLAMAVKAAEQCVHTDPPSACPVCGTLPEEMEHDPTCPLATAGG